MKRLFAMLLALAMVFALIGCTIGAGAVVGQTQTCAVQDMKIAVIGKDQAIQPGQVVEAGAVI